MFPELFHIGHFSIPTYGVLAAAGLIFGLILCVHYAKREGFDEDQCWNMGVIAIFAGLLGAKLMFLVVDWDTYRHLDKLFTWEMLRSGGVWYGGLIGAVTAGTIYTLLHHWPVLKTADAYAPGIAFGHSLGRLGCLAAGCCYGRPTNVSWGIVFHNPLSAQQSGTPLNVRLQPTQIYEWAAEFIVFLVLIWLYKRKTRPGQVAGTYLIGFGIARFIIEFWRYDPDRGSMFGGAITVTQFISILLVVLGGALWMQWSAAKQPETAAA